MSLPTEDYREYLGALQGALPYTISPDADLEDIKGKASGNLILNGAKQYAERKADLLSLKDRLTKENEIELGDIAGIGNLGGITYRIKNKKGEIIKSAVVRFDMAHMVADMNSPAYQPQCNPAFIKPVHQTKGNIFAATIVPIAKKRVFSDQEIRDSLSIINTNGKLPYLGDILPGQFMELEGMELNGKPIAVLADIGSVLNIEPGMPRTGAALLAGSIEHYIHKKSLNPQKFYEAKIPWGDFSILCRKQGEIDRKLRQELAEKKIVLPSPAQVVQAGR